jgi:hypothetical protein
MKKLSYLVLFLILMIPIAVKASEITISCTHNIRPGQTSTCNLVSLSPVTMVRARISINNFTDTANGSFSKETSGQLLHYVSLTGGTNIATLNITIPANHTQDRYTFTLTEITYIFSGETQERTQPVRTVNIVVNRTTTTTTTRRPTTTTRAGQNTTTTRAPTTTTRGQTTTTTTTTQAAPSAPVLMSLTIEGQTINFFLFF